MSENDSNAPGNSHGSQNSGDWHEQPTQGPNNQGQYGQQYGQSQDAGQQYGQQQGYGQTYSSQPQGQGYQQYGSSQGYEAQGQYGQPYQESNQNYGQQQYGNQGYGQQYGDNAYGQGAYAQPYTQKGYAPAQGQYGQYGQPGSLGGPYGQLSSWGKRFAATLIDMLCLAPFWILAAIFVPRYTLNTTTGEKTQTGGNMAITVILYLLAFAFVLWNQCYQQGKTGQSIGKKAMGLKLISEASGQPLGFGMAFVRQIAHFLDSIPCYVGYLWPLWDAKRQTFADKVMSSLVVDVPKN